PYLAIVSLDLLVKYEDDGEAMTYPIPDPDVDLELHVELAEVQSAIAGFLQTLEPRDREFVERVFWNDESQADIARAFNVSGAAISKRMGRIAQRGRIALAHLRGSQLLQ